MAEGMLIFLCALALLGGASAGFYHDALAMQYAQVVAIVAVALAIHWKKP